MSARFPQPGTAAAGSTQHLLAMLIMGTLFGAASIVPIALQDQAFSSVGAMIAAGSALCVINVCFELAELRRYPQILDRQTYLLFSPGPLSGQIHIHGRGPSALFLAWGPIHKSFSMMRSVHVAMTILPAPGTTLDNDPATTTALTRQVRITNPGTWSLDIEFMVTPGLLTPRRPELLIIARGQHDAQITLPPCEQLDHIGAHGFPVIPLAKLSPQAPNP
jgi:hypothetical protein